MTEWVVLELTPQGEDEDPEVLKSSILRTLKGSQVFVPASISIVGDSRVVHKLIDNYVFVRRDQPDQFYFRVEGSKYVASVLTVPNGRARKISPVRDSDVAKMKRQIQVETEQGIEVGDEVEVMSGAYKGIHGKIIEEIPENDSVQVYIALRSKQAIVTLPRSFLRFVPLAQHLETPFAPFLTKLTRAREWVSKAHGPLSIQRFDFAPLADKELLLERLRPWAGRVSRLVHSIVVSKVLASEPPLASTEPLARVLRRASLLGRFQSLSRDIDLAEGLQSYPSLDSLIDAFGTVLHLREKANPLSVLRHQLEHLETVAQYQSVDRARLVKVSKDAEALGRILLQYRLLKYQIGKIESVIRKVEQDNARKKRHR